MVMTKDQQKLFEDAGIKSNDDAGMLALILAAPEAVAKNIGVESVVRAAIECAINMSKEHVSEMLNFKVVPTGLGSLAPPTGAPVTKKVVPAMSPKDLPK